MGFLHWPTFFYTFIACGAVLYILILLQFKRKEKRPGKYMTFDDLCDVGKTGDLLIVAYTSIRARYVKFFTRSRWTHCAFIIKRAEGINVVEIARYGDGTNGIVVWPLQDWFNKHKRCTVVYRPLTEGSDAILTANTETFIHTHRDAKPDLNVVSWAKTLKRTAYWRDEPKSCYYCSEFVIRYLQCVGIVEKKYDPASYKPWELACGVLPLKTGYVYDEFVLVGHHDDEVGDA